MVEATVKLLRERPPEQITVRDIAEASGHHHRFVQAWFGNKVGLFRAAFDRMLEARAEGMAGTILPGGMLDADLQAIVRLMNWLVATDPASLEGPRTTPILDRLVEIYRDQYGFSQDMARLMALRVVSASIAGLLFPGPLGITSDDIGAIGRLERRLAELLAESIARGDPELP
jgi:AcrR family transcriptional regulator